MIRKELTGFLGRQRMQQIEWPVLERAACDCDSGDFVNVRIIIDHQDFPGRPGVSFEIRF